MSAVTALIRATLGNDQRRTARTPSVMEHRIVSQLGMCVGSDFARQRCQSAVATAPRCGQAR